MESRKRPHEGEEPVSVKKRAIISSNDSPVTAVSSTAADDQPLFTAELESFQKEAIYRRMKHYSREVERSQQLINQLQVKTLSYEASLIAIETCWDQLLQQVHLLVKPGQISSLGNEPELFSLTREVSPGDETQKALAEALDNREKRTTDLLKSILAATPRLSPPDVFDLQKACQRLQSEKVGIKGELTLVRTRLSDATSAAEKYLEQLSVTENRLERLKSETVQNLGMKPRAPDPVKEEQLGAQPNGKHIVKSEPNDALAQPNGHISSMLEAEWKIRVDERDKAISRLQTDYNDLSQQFSKARMELAAPSFETLQSLKAYKALQATVDQHKKLEESARGEAAALRDLMAQMKVERQEWQARVQVEANVKVTDLKGMIEKKEADLTRVRGLRDALQADVNERKARDGEREGSLSQSKILASARGERVAMLVAENHRLKAKLSAREGEESFYTFIMSNPQDESFVRVLEERVNILQRSKDALETTLKSISAASPDVAAAARSEAEERAKSMELQQRLDRFEAIYGPEALVSASPELQQLSEQLEKKEAELRRVRLELKASLEEPSMLCMEVERMSALWENLDKQLKSKIFDLSTMEEKLSKSVTEKSKADNKFFAAMRELDALKGVQAGQAREITKQTKVIERLVESEKSLNRQIAHFEKESQLQAKAVAERDSMLVNASLQTEREHAQVELGNRRVQELQEQIRERDALLMRQRNEHTALSEKCEEFRRQANSEVAKYKAANATGNEAELLAERDKLMTLLRCSTCKIQLRSHVLKQCMHTFCKECIDARVTTRQRKCPHCQLAFSTSDVQQIYFQ